MKQYEKLYNKNIENAFNDYMNSINLEPIDYLAFGIQNNENFTSTSIMSNQEWQKEFCRLELYKYDPIRKCAFYSKKKVVPFDEIDCSDSSGSYVMKLRRKYKIKDGIIFIERNHRYNVLLTLGTSFSKFNASNFIDNKIPECINVLYDLKRIIIKNMHIYHNKNENI